MNKKMLYKIVPVIFVFCIIISNVFGYGSNFGDGFHPEDIPSGNRVTQIETPVQRIWGTISLILQICAVGGIIFTGVRYMFATADAKSDIKKTLPYLIAGCVIVFAAAPLIDFIVKVFEETTAK